MNRLLLLFSALFTVGSLLAQSRIEEFTVNSGILGTEKTCSVYLPFGYDTSERSYPVLYLLHGASDTHTAWLLKGNLQQIMDEAIAAGTSLPMIVVMPDASGEGENHTGPHMGYFDVPGWEYEKFFFQAFMHAVENNYRILSDKSHRAIAGLSMGGGGAIAYAMHRPELFSSACSMSGVLNAFPGPRSYVNDMISSVAANSPTLALETWSEEQIVPLRTVRWYADCGDDDFLYQSNIRFYELMRQRKITLQYRMRDGGHSWRYWSTSLPEILTFVSIGFAK